MIYDEPAGRRIYRPLRGRLRLGRKPVPGWRPDAASIAVISGDLMEGECAGDQAFGARFRHATAPAFITVWAFAAECGPCADPGSCFVAYRADYMVTDDEGDGSWSWMLYEGDVAHSEWYAGAGPASAAARQSAAALMSDGPAAAAIHVPSGVVAGWFDWDGAPW